MCIAGGACNSQEISAQARGKECKPSHFATVCQSESSSKLSAQAANNSGPIAGLFEWCQW
jgi:hypothetical protein